MKYWHSLNFYRKFYELKIISHMHFITIKYISLWYFGACDGLCEPSPASEAGILVRNGGFKHSSPADISSNKL